MNRLALTFAAAMLAVARFDAAEPGARRPNILFALSDDPSFPHASAKLQP